MYEKGNISFRELLSLIEMNRPIKDYYINEYPSDPVARNLNGENTFQDLLMFLRNGKGCVYEFLGAGDSMIRENVFTKLSEILNVEYDFIYDLWIDLEEEDQ